MSDVMELRVLELMGTVAVPSDPGPPADEQPVPPGRRVPHGPPPASRAALAELNELQARLAEAQRVRAAPR